MSDVSATGGAYIPAIATDRYAATRAAPDYGARQQRFDDLTATVLDTSGKSSDDQRVQAYETLHSLSVTGQLIGVGDDRAKVYDQITSDSDVGRRAQALQQQFGQAVNGAVQAGGPQAALKAVASSFDALSPSDQNLLFRTTINAADRTGAKPYADVQAWRDNVDAQQKMVGFMKSAGVVTGNGALDQKAAAAKAVSDPKFAAALRLSLRRDNNSSDWTQAVIQLFGGNAPKDTVQLSDAAKQYLSAAPANAAAPAAPAEPAYTQGSIISRTA